MSNRAGEAEVPTQSLTQNPSFSNPTSIEIRTTDTSSDTSSIVPTSIAEAVSPISDPGSNLTPGGKTTKGAGALPSPNLLLPEPARVYQICSEGFIRRQLKVRESGGQRILYTASTNSIFSRKPKISIHSTASSNPSSINNNYSSSQEKQQQQQTLIASAALHIFSRDGIDLHLETTIDRNGKPCQVKIICPSHDPKSFCFLSSGGFMRWQQQEKKRQDGGNGSRFELVSDGSGRILAVFSGTSAKWPSAKCGRLMSTVEGRLLDEIVMSCLAIMEQERRRWSPAGMVARWRLG